MQTYDRSTPETDAFMLQIDDSEIDIGQVEGKLQQLECQRDYALECLAELHAALVRYEGDVDGEAPSEHRRMMDRAAAILSENVQSVPPERSAPDA